MRQKKRKSRLKVDKAWCEAINQLAELHRDVKVKLDITLMLDDSYRALLKEFKRQFGDGYYKELKVTAKTLGYNPYSERFLSRRMKPCLAEESDSAKT